MKLAQLRYILPLLFYYSFIQAQTNYASYVNPFIGTGGHGHTFPGAVLPFGMVQLSPDTRVDGSWDGCSGYHYSDKVIYGFSHTHLSGTGCSDWGDILVMPTIGEPSLNNGIYSSPFNHKSEIASPGFYSVVLKDGKIKAELTVTPRVGIHRYTFPKTTEANLILDLLHRDKTLGCFLQVIDSVTVVGYRFSEAWAKDQKVFFAMNFSKPFKKTQMGAGKKIVPELAMFQLPEGAYFRFDVSDGKPLMVKVAISPVSIQGAIKNMAAEATHWDFRQYKQEAENAWNKQLQKISIAEKNTDKLATFYTALYHCSIHPSLNMDVDKQYRGRDNKIHTAEGFINYSVFSLWDTYRALNPLFTLIERKRVTDIINSFLNQYRQSGRLPMWELSSNETDCMVGYHSVSVIADAMAKGIRGFDTTLMYQAVKAASNYTAYGLPLFNRNGFLQVDDESESISKSLEYAYDDWCIAQIAKRMRQPKDVTLYLERSQAYKDLFDASMGFMRPRKNGSWLTPFYPSEINNHFTEGNSWQYSFYVPHDIEGLITLHGGKDKFEQKLDELFTTKEKTKGRDQADVTGLIGQYAHGNEPSHHMAYLYNFVGKPQKTIERTHQICKNFYKNAPDGLIGNEDCGQMSAWYVMSSMGLYAVCPGNPVYSLSEPIFKSVTINPEDGKAFVITANSGKEITSVSVNGSMSLRSNIDHTTVVAGGTLNYVYDKTVKENNYGKAPASIISSSVSVPDFMPVPLINASSRVFKDQLEISLEQINGGKGTLIYTTNGSEPDGTSKIYTGPFIINSNSTIKAKAFFGYNESHSTEAHFYKLKYNYDITIKSNANPQYAAEGAQTFVDGIAGDVNWRKGNWLGYQSQDFECLVDLKEKKPIDYVSLDCLQDTRAWIVLPSEVSFYASEDNKTFTLIATVPSSVKANDYTVQAFNFKKQLMAPVTTQYIKVVAKNFGKLPEWHEGKGGDAYIFVDELEVK